MVEKFVCYSCNMLRKNQAILLFMLTLIPLLSPIFVNTYFFFRGVPETATEISSQVDLMVMMSAILWIYVGFLLIFYIWYVFKSKQTILIFGRLP